MMSITGTPGRYSSVSTRAVVYSEKTRALRSSGSPAAFRRSTARGAPPCGSRAPPPSSARTRARTRARARGRQGNDVDDRGQPAHEPQVGAHQLADSRALDLDGDRGAVGQLGAVDLTDRAAASGRQSNDRKSASTGRPSSCSIICRTSAAENGRTWLSTGRTAGSSRRAGVEAQRQRLAQLDPRSTELLESGLHALGPVGAAAAEKPGDEEIRPYRPEDLQAAPYDTPVRAVGLGVATVLSPARHQPARLHTKEEQTGRAARVSRSAASHRLS